MIGNKDTLAFVLGNKNEKDLREVDIWIANELVTFIDNTAYLPQFISSLESELDDLKSGNVDSDYVFLNLGPTLDDVSVRVELDGSHIFIKCCLYINDGKIFSVKMNKDELMESYETCIKRLKNA